FGSKKEAEARLEEMELQKTKLFARDDPDAYLKWVHLGLKWVPFGVEMGMKWECFGAELGVRMGLKLGMRWLRFGAETDGFHG
ncbi:hypothetical protein Tco_1270260, partial [Tanacetum coccineum]